MKIIKIKQQSESTTLAEVVEVIFTESDMKLFERFINNLNNLKDVKLLQKEIPVLKSIVCNKEGELKFVHSDYDYEDIKALLHSLRHFILIKDAPASFTVIKKILGEVTKQVDEKEKLSLYFECLKYIGDVYNKGLYAPYFQIKINEIDLFTQENLDFWLNGREYHQNEQKEKEVKKLEEVLGEETSRVIYISQLFGKIEAILMLGKLINSLINKGEIIIAKEVKGGKSEFWVGSS